MMAGQDHQVDFVEMMRTFPIKSCTLDLHVMQRGVASPIVPELTTVVEQLVSKYYKKSAMPWNTKSKIKELSQPGMHHFVVRLDTKLVCFVSVLACKEMNMARKLEPVLYIYELHVLPEYQGLGLGKWILSSLIPSVQVSLVAFKSSVKAMLTCQTANSKALEFYLRSGFTPDEICPSRCLSRTEFSQLGYKILSRPIKPSM